MALILGSVLCTGISANATTIDAKPENGTTQTTVNAVQQEKDANGNILNGWDPSGKYYYKDGVKVKGFQWVEDSLYYFTSSGKLYTKKGLRKIPLVGVACEYAHHIFVDKSGPSKIRASYDKAREELKEGMSLVVFPEGARTFTGHMGVFRRGAFMLADELQLPVCPLTINGSFQVKPRMKDIFWVFWHPLKLTIHKPIAPIGRGADNIKHQMTESYEAIMNGLDKEYQGFVENPDQ